jgi:SAM-dependent methyltransferase
MIETNFFSAGSPYLEHPLLTPKRTEEEVDFILSQIDLPPGGRVLDVGCGAGRHCIALAQRGYRVVGIDPSEAMLAAARARASTAGVDVDFHQVRGEDYTSQEAFDAAVCLFTTLGQVEGGSDNSALVGRTAEALQPGGFFVVEVPQRRWVAQNLKTEERLREGQSHTQVTRRYNPTKKRVTERFERVSPHGQRAYLLRYRLYSIPELHGLLEAAGFDVLEVYGGYANIPVSLKSPIMLFVARKI